VTITVTDSGDPTAVDDTAATTEDMIVTTPNVLNNDTVIDNATITNFDATSVNGGTVVDNGDGTFDYTPALGFVGDDTFTYTLCDDDTPASCSTATVTLVVSPNQLDLSIEKSVIGDNLTPHINTNIIFEIVVTNNSGVRANEVVVSEILPLGYTFISSSTDEGNFDEYSEIWNIGTIEGGNSAVLLIEVVVNPNGDYMNCATITSLTQIDTDSTNDSSCIGITPIIPLVIPEEFTPNGDGINDLFEIENLQLLYPDFKIEIINRWGNRVFEYTHNGNPNQSPIWWDGFSNGRWNLSNEEIPVGTYFYSISFNDNERAPKTGWIYLRR